jgi:hypothetical protein
LRLRAVESSKDLYRQQCARPGSGKGYIDLHQLVKERLCVMLLLDLALETCKLLSISRSYPPAGLSENHGDASVTQATACSLRKNRPVVFLLVRAP